jgi:hypothetical protein
VVAGLYAPRAGGAGWLIVQKDVVKFVRTPANFYRRSKQVLSDVGKGLTQLINVLDWQASVKSLPASQRSRAQTRNRLA